MPGQKTQNNEFDVALRSIKSTFEAGEIKRMIEVAKLYPTKIITGLGLNHSRYIAKLSRPESFTIKEVIRFSRFIGVDHEKVLAVILNEVLPNILTVEEERNQKRSKRVVNKKSTSSKSKKTNDKAKG
ncbi:MAG TPA: hypothetical protein PKV73_02965 [Agriterribacter sp.]|nr:hypothetical protein [Agriterribacter sp.]